MPKRYDRPTGSPSLATHRILCVLVLAVAAVLLAAATNVMHTSAENEIRRKATFLCQYETVDNTSTCLTGPSYSISTGYPAAELFPDGEVATDYLAQDDIRFSAADRERQSWFEERRAVLPAMKALMEAKAPFMRCRVRSVQVKGSDATVEVELNGPRVALDRANGPELKTLMQASSHVSRLAIATSQLLRFYDWFLPKNNSRAIWHFVDSPDGWVANFELRKEALRNRAGGGSLLQEARIRARRCDPRAGPMLDEFLRPQRSPDATTLAKADEALDRLWECALGRWTKRGRVIGLPETVGSRVAGKAMGLGLEKTPATLTARCLGHALDLSVSFGDVADAQEAAADYVSDITSRQVPVRLALGTRKPQRLALTTQYFRTAAFPEPDQWIQRFVQTTPGEVSLEIPFLVKSPAKMLFELDGSDRLALLGLRSICQREIPSSPERPAMEAAHVLAPNLPAWDPSDEAEPVDSHHCFKSQPISPVGALRLLPTAAEFQGGKRPVNFDFIVNESRNQIRSCYELELIRDPSLAGTVWIRMRTGQYGLVTDAVVDESDLGNERVETCLVAAARKWQFITAPEEIRLPISFVTGNPPFGESQLPECR